MSCSIRKMVKSDIEAIAATFASWNKTREQYDRYFDENERGVRVTFVALVDNNVVGYANVLWEAPCP